MIVPGFDGAPSPQRVDYREWRRVYNRQHNLRRKPCPQCGRPIQSGNLARHRRTHEREYRQAS